MTSAKTLYFWHWIFIFFLLGTAACTDKAIPRIPADEVMHFPYSMALRGKTLVIGSTSADKEYDYGRLVTIDTDKLKAAIPRKNTLDYPIPWNTVVMSNTLIPRDIGEISFTKDFIAFPSRETSELVALPVANNESNCNAPQELASSCSGALSLKLSDLDPYALLALPTEKDTEFILMSYESSDRIDIVKVNPISKENTAVVKSFHAKDDWLLKKMEPKLLKNQRFITRKIQASFSNVLDKARVYFLLEGHPWKNKSVAKAKGAYLVAIKMSDLLSKDITSEMIEVYNLSELFNVSGAQDFFINETENTRIAYVLSRVPELLLKIDLKRREMLASKVVCTGATSMAVSGPKDLLVIPCFADNLIAAYSISSLSLKQVSKRFGRGPSYVVIDDRNSLIYCSYFDGGFVAILDEKLNYLAHLFNKADQNRKGS